MKAALAYIGLGSNVGDSAGYVREAFAALARVGKVTAISDLYLTAPWGVVDQAPFVNAVAAVKTTLSAPELVNSLIAIEREFGRTREVRNGPRTLDLDVLLYGDRSIDVPGCTIPHPQLHRRAFALAPLAQIATGVRVPATGKTAAELLAALAPADRGGVRRLHGTAHLPPAPYVDYDAPGGAGEEYAQLRPFSSFDAAVLDAVLSVLGPIDGRRILDVGCGTGRFTRELAARGARVIGIDRSETMLNAARATPFEGSGMPPEFVRGDANVALPGSNYDAITVFYALQYLRVPIFCRVAAAALAPGGTLAIASFPHRHFAESEFAQFFPSMVAIDLARFPSRIQLEADLTRAGFASVRATMIELELRDRADLVVGKVERKYLSSFHLLPDDEFQRGLAAMRKAWLPDEHVRRTAHAMVVWGTR